mgnify:CR=1 FL=1
MSGSDHKKTIFRGASGIRQDIETLQKTVYLVFNKKVKIYAKSGAQRKIFWAIKIFFAPPGFLAGFGEK